MQDSTPQNTEPIVNPIVNNPPPDEGVEDNKQPSADEDLKLFFGAEASEIVGNAGITAKGEFGVKTETPEQPIETPQPITEEKVNKIEEQAKVDNPTFTQSQIDEIVNQKVAEEVKKFESINTFFEEYQKDPYAFMAKSAPHLFEKFNEVDYVKDKLNTEFGEFYPDPSRVWEIGTTDYNYRIRQQELVAEAQSLKRQARETISNQQSLEEQSEQSYKTSKAQSLGLDISTFESRIWNKLKSMDNQSVLDTLVDAVIYKEKLEEKDKNIKQQIDLTKGVPSPSNLSGVGKPIESNKDLVELRKMFGDEFD